LWTPGADPAPAAWSQFSRRLDEDASAIGYIHRDREAAAHLFRVTAGLDSMVLGEAQIQGQVGDAWERSRAFSGAVLNRLFQTAQLAAGRVRAETHVARGAASVSSAAVQLAKQIFGSLRGRRAMVLGAGEMAELALGSFTGEGVHAAIVANRSFGRAEEIAARYGAQAIHFDDGFWGALDDVDVLLCSTAAPVPVVPASRLRTAAGRRGGRPLCVLDIALPRDVEPSAREIDSVYLYDLDDLQAVVHANLARRRGELPSAEAVIADEVAKFWGWVAGLAAVPTLTAMRVEMDRLREAELSAAFRRLGGLSDDERSAVEQLSRALMNKFLHAPSVRLRAAAANGRGLGVVDTARYLFGLDSTTGGYGSESAREGRDADATARGDEDAPDHAEPVRKT
ncbi:MAG: glutamyl-tRNA reductase, partial [Gemmatimonadaceae bacterium]|nr:glutamyl-tRNA reductase [Gemmatimonadaceae bacterium]